MEAKNKAKQGTKLVVRPFFTSLWTPLGIHGLGADTTYAATSAV
jgi:hypothetical protein